MMISYKSANIHFKDQGQGPAVVLFHGYLETLEIWNDFALELSKSFRVISIDIPGHGKSGKFAEVHQMDQLAEVTDEILKSLDIKKAFFVGHSMGGYVALAYLANYSPKVTGICLFHSTPFADTEEKKASRNKEIELIRQGQQDAIFQVNVPKGFATDNLERFSEKVTWAIKLARGCEPEGIIALLEGLKSRPDRQDLLKQTNVPVLFILGKKDNYISYELMNTVAQRTPRAEILTLENSGHMGFIEEPEVCIKTLSSFILQHARG